MEDVPTDLAATEPLPNLGVPPAAGRRWWVEPARWAGELATVFVGVYAAFMLNRYQTHRQERQRRDQIIEWAQGAYSGLLTGMTTEEAAERRAADEFNRRVAAGETPALHVAEFRTDYNPADFTSLLQSGGFDLLEIETVRDIRDVEGTLRQMVETARHHQQLGDALILPNLDQPPGFFYEVSRRRLRPGYAWYAADRATELELYSQVCAQTSKLLVQLRTERQRNR